MGTSYDAATGVLAAVATVAGVVAVALAVVTVGLLRRSVRRLTRNLEELRRHPLVGLIPSETEPELRPLTTELNHLLEDLRARLHETEKRRRTSRGSRRDLPTSR